MSDVEKISVSRRKSAARLAAAASASPYGQASRRPGPQPIGAPGLAYAGAGSSRRLMVLSSRVGECCAVDLETGAFVRASWPGAPLVDVRPYQVVLGHFGPYEGVPDPGRPEAVKLVGCPEEAPSIKGRQVRRYLRDIVTAPGQALLGFPGLDIPYWTLNGAYPSVAIIQPEGDVQVRVRREEQMVWGHFRWGRMEQSLAVLDSELAHYLAAAVGDRIELAKQGLEQLLGFRPYYLLVLLTPPIEGRCYKTLGAFLPKP